MNELHLQLDKCNSVSREEMQLISSEKHSLTFKGGGVLFIHYSLELMEEESYLSMPLVIWQTMPFVVWQINMY